MLGPGRRVGLWVQGCSIGCKACVSRDTWSTEEGASWEVSSLLEFIQERYEQDAAEGITISGGEPFDQPQALQELLASLTRLRNANATHFNVICYSGYSLERLKAQHSELLQHIDVLISDPFVPATGQTGQMRGSSNQRVTAFTDVGHSIVQCMDSEDNRPRMQLAVENGRVWFVGIPRIGDMERLQSLAASRGVTLKDPSWLA